MSKFPQIIRAFQNASRAASGALTRHYLQGGAERCGTYIDHDIDALGCAVVWTSARWRSWLGRWRI